MGFKHSPSRAATSNQTHLLCLHQGNSPLLSQNAWPHSHNRTAAGAKINHITSDQTNDSMHPCAVRCSVQAVPQQPPHQPRPRTRTLACTTRSSHHALGHPPRQPSSAEHPSQTQPAQQTFHSSQTLHNTHNSWGKPAHGNCNKTAKGECFTDVPRGISCRARRLPLSRPSSGSQQRGALSARTRPPARGRCSWPAPSARAG
jgi:hypothetical protein